LADNIKETEMAKIKVPSPVIDEAVKETAKQEKLEQLKKEQKIRDRYFRWMAIRNKEKDNT
jgi:hypothetical protein